MSKNAVTLLLQCCYLFGLVAADCLVGDIMYQEGDSIGYIGYECLNSTFFSGTTSECGPDGQVVDSNATLECGAPVPFCVQCGSPSFGAALCLSESTAPSYCAEIAENDSVAADTSGCLIDDIMYQEGDSIGYIGYECLNSTFFSGTTSECGPDGQVVDSNATLECGAPVPFCVQCGSLSFGAALCLSESTAPSYCADSDDSASAKKMIPSWMIFASFLIGSITNCFAYFSSL